MSCSRLPTLYVCCASGLYVCLRTVRSCLTLCLSAAGQVVFNSVSVCLRVRSCLTLVASSGRVEFCLSVCASGVCNSVSVCVSDRVYLCVYLRVRWCLTVCLCAPPQVGLRVRRRAASGRPTGRGGLSSGGGAAAAGGAQPASNTGSCTSSRSVPGTIPGMVPRAQSDLSQSSNRAPAHAGAPGGRRLELRVRRFTEVF